MMVRHDSGKRTNTRLCPNHVLNSQVLISDSPNEANNKTIE